MILLRSGLGALLLYSAGNVLPAGPAAWTCPAAAADVEGAATPDKLQAPPAFDDLTGVAAATDAAPSAAAPVDARPPAAAATAATPPPSAGAGLGTALAPKLDTACRMASLSPALLMPSSCAQRSRQGIVRFRQSPA